MRNNYEMTYIDEITAELMQSRAAPLLALVEPKMAQGMKCLMKITAGYLVSSGW